MLLHANIGSHPGWEWHFIFHSKQKVSTGSLTLRRSFFSVLIDEGIAHDGRNPALEISANFELIPGACKPEEPFPIKSLASSRLTGEQMNKVCFPGR